MLVTALSGIIFALIIVFSMLMIRINHRVVTCILIMAVYINVLKPLTGSRYAPLLIDLLLMIIFFKIVMTKLVKEKKLVFYSKTIEIAISVFFVISIIQIFNPNIPRLVIGIEGFRKTTYQMLAVFMGAYYIRDYKEARKMIKWLCIASIPVLLYGIKQYFFYSPFDYRIISLNNTSMGVFRIRGSLRSFSIFSGPFHFGMYACMTAVISLYFYFINRKFIYTIIFIMSIFGVFFSMTRVNLAALMASIVFFITLTEPVKRKLFNKTKIVLVFSLLVVVVFSSKYFTNTTRIFKTFKNIKNDRRFMARFASYRYMTKNFKKNPVIGYGMGSAGDTLGRKYRMRTHFTSHNMMFKILMETGIFGLILYLMFFLFWFYKAFCLAASKNLHIKNFAVLLMSLVIIILVNGLTGSTIEAYPINMYAWCFMGILIKLYAVERIKIYPEVDNGK